MFMVLYLLSVESLFQQLWPTHKVYSVQTVVVVPWLMPFVEKLCMLKYISDIFEPFRALGLS